MCWNESSVELHSGLGKNVYGSIQIRSHITAVSLQLQDLLPVMVSSGSRDPGQMYQTNGPYTVVWPFGISSDTV